MVKIRLTRMGDKKTPFYRIIVADSRSCRDGKFVDILGNFDPLAKTDDNIKIDVEKAKQWLANGAQPTDTVRTLLARAGVLTITKRAPAKTKVAKKKKA